MTDAKYRSTNPDDFLSLADLERGHRANYEAGAVTRDTLRELYTDMVALLTNDPAMLLSDAIDKAGENRWPADDHCICRYDLRQAATRRLASAAAAINKAGGKATPLATVKRALNPPAPAQAAAELSDDAPAGELVA
jgi:hypothetical protein